MVATTAVSNKPAPKNQHSGGNGSIRTTDTTRLHLNPPEPSPPPRRK